MKVITRCFLYAVLLSLLFQSCKNDKKDKITIGYLPIVAHLPMEIAKENNLLDDLNIQYKVYGTSEDLVYDLRDNKIQVATTIAIAPLMKIIQKEEGEPENTIKIFSYSSTGKNNPFDGVFVKNNSNINSLKDLKGKKIGVFPGTTAMNIMALLLERDYNINRHEVEYIMLPPPAQIQAIESGNIDALFTYETVRTKCILAGLKPIHGSVVASVLNNAPYGCSAINSSFIKENRRAAKQIIKSFDQGYIALENDPINARNILNSNLGVSEAVANQCNLENRILSSHIKSRTNYAVFRNFIQILHSSGDIQSSEINDNLLYD